MTSILIISGSPNKSSRLNGIIQYAERYLTKYGEVKTLHVCDLPSEDLMFARYDSPHIKRAIEQVNHADFIIVASQVYKASFTGVLKVFLDLLPQKGLENKPVLPIVLGGTLAHQLVINHSFKPLLSTLGAFPIFNGVYTVDTNVKWEEDGTFIIEEKSRHRLDNAFNLISDQKGGAVSED